MARVTGTNGNDMIRVGEASAGVVPPTGATNESDTIEALDGTDTVAAGGGNDRLDGGPGRDTLAGGTGNDSYTVDNFDRVIEIASSIDAGIDFVQSTVDFFLPDDVENLALLGTAIRGTGNALSNFIQGNDGNNFLDGLGGVDILNGGPGRDTLAGGTDNDSYTVDNVGDQVRESPGAGTDRVVSRGVSFTLPDNVENLTMLGTENIDGTGNVLANVIRGNNGNNTLSGLGGNDTLDGGTGSDFYVVDNLGDQVSEIAGGAGAGTDFVESTVSFTLPADIEHLRLGGTGNINGTGNAGNNIIAGNNGNNTLTGGPGGDALFGQAGNDTFDFNAVEDAPASGGEAVLAGFSGVEGIGDLGGDVFDVSTIDANTTMPGNQAFTFIETALFNAPGQLRMASASGGGKYAYPR